MTDTRHCQTKTALITTRVTLGVSIGYWPQFKHLDHFLNCAFHFIVGHSLNFGKVAQVFTSGQLQPENVVLRTDSQ
jgi:hypothetical protein